MSDIRLVADAEIKRLIQKIDQVNKKIDSVTKQTQKTEAATNKAGKSFDLLATYAQVAGAAFGAMRLVQVAADFAKLGAASQRAGDALNAITSGKADQYIEAITRATGGAVSQLDAMSIASRSLSLGVVQSAEDMEKLTQVAVALGRRMGLSATQAINDLSTGVGRLSPMILDNLGLSISLSSSYENYARTIGKAANELTKAEQQQAVLNAVLAEGEKTIEQMGGVTLDTAGKFEKLQAFVADAKTAIGELVLLDMTPSIDAALLLADAWREVDNALKGTGKPFEELSESEKDLLRWRNAMEEATKSTRDFNGMSLDKGVLQLVAVIRELTRKEEDLEAQTRAASRAQSEANELTEMAAAYQYEQAQATDRAAAATAGWANAADVMSGAAYDSAAAFEKFNEQAEIDAKLQERLYSTAKGYVSIAEDITEATKDMGKTVYYTTGQNADAAAEYDYLSGQIERTAEQIQELTWQAATFGDESGDLGNRINDLTGTLGALQARAAVVGAEIGGTTVASIQGISEEGQRAIDSGFVSFLEDSGAAAIYGADAVLEFTHQMGLMSDEVFEGQMAMFQFQQAMDSGLALDKYYAIWDNFWKNSGNWITDSEGKMKLLNLQLQMATQLFESSKFGTIDLRGIDFSDEATMENLGGFAGGGSFITSGPSTITVGDNPGGRELVNVIPLSGKGTTHFRGNRGAFAGGGSLLSMGDQPVQLNVTLMMDAEKVGQVSIQGTVGELQNMGYELTRAA